MRLISTTVLLAFAMLTLRPAFADSYVEGPYLTFNLTTGKVYSRHNAFDRWYPASITKMMTAYTVFREIGRGHVSMLSPVRISANAGKEPPSKMGFPRGTILTVENALKIILVKSANDVATALAESIGGSEAGFSRLMNRYAAEIGMENSHFVNAHGLHSVAHYSSAHDLGILARQIYREFPQYQDLFKIGAIKIGKRILRNHNALIRRLPGAIGLKTGFICAGGISIVASAKKGDDIIVSILLGERKSRIRNVRVAEFLVQAMNSDRLPDLHLDEMKPLHPVRPPVDIRPQVCGRKARKTATFMFEDPAIEYYAVKQPESTLTLAEREARVFPETENSFQPVVIKIGGATGPDPYELLVEKPPLKLVDDDAPMDKRHELKNGKLVAVPTKRPSS